ncbi:MAG: hypothetical protein ACRD29_08185 [Acidimicrobiales bacterium]
MRARAWLVLFAGMAVVVAIGVSIIWLVTRSDDETAGGDNGATTTEESTTTASPTSTVPTTTSLETPDDFRRVFVELMNRRAEIFTTNPDPNRVDEYATAFPPMYQEDKDDLAELQTRNLRFATPRVVLLGVRFEDYVESERTALLAAVIDLPAVRVLDPNDAVAEELPAQGRFFVDVALQQVEGRWRVLSFASVSGLAEEAYEAVIAQGVPEA